MNVNTDEMRKVASEISSLATQYQTLITNLYKSISEMTSNNSWVGDRAKEYVNYVLLDKPDLVAVGERIKSFSKVIVDNASLLESKVSSIERDES